MSSSKSSTAAKAFNAPIWSDGNLLVRPECRELVEYPSPVSNSKSPELSAYNQAPAQRNSITWEVAHAKTRFRMLRRLSANHDNEGALAPQQTTVDMAIAFLDKLNGIKNLLATLTDDGEAVIEVNEPERGFFGEFTFFSDGRIECYRRLRNESSITVEGTLDSDSIAKFVNEEMRSSCAQQ